MATFWEQVKQTMDTSAKAVKDFTVSVSDKTQDMVSLGQLKLKHYNLSRDVSNKFTALGSKSFDLMTSSKADIYSNADVKKIIVEIQSAQKAIKDVEREIESVS
ncbi:hypothetical protein JW960_09285 [candidate division KSB1 bacterium]|nr:hypothetical protein [candidate division KSB1 bacterium]